MDTAEIARNNHTFYYVVVGQHLLEGEFARAFLRSFHEPVLYGIEEQEYSGYIHIDCTGIAESNSVEMLREAVSEGRFLSGVAMRIPRSIIGPMNTDATVIRDGWQFSFRITKYERDSEHSFEPIEDPSSLPAGERLGRYVELTITQVPT